MPPQVEITDRKKSSVFTKLLFLGLFLFFSLAFFNEVNAQGGKAAESIRNGLEATADTVGSQIVRGRNQLPTTIGVVISALLTLIAVLFFILSIYGGILWMSARGNADLTKKAKNTIIAAIAGIIVVMGAYAITNFVLKSVETDGSFDRVNRSENSGTCPVNTGQACSGQVVGSNCVRGTPPNDLPGSCVMTTIGVNATNPRCTCEI